jgi:hypothetical protein
MHTMHRASHRTYSSELTYGHKRTYSFAGIPDKAGPRHHSPRFDATTPTRGASGYSTVRWYTC